MSNSGMSFNFGDLLKSVLAQGLLQQFAESGPSFFPGTEGILGEGTPLSSLFRLPAGNMMADKAAGVKQNSMTFPLLLALLRQRM